jgi:hypothetical protein
MAEKKTVAAVVDAGGGSQMLEVVAPTDLLAISKAEIDLQIATAKNFPRSIAQFQSGAGAMVSYSQEISETMFYKLPRGGKLIEGPSVRFAEIIGQNWRNCRIGARVLGAEEKQVVSQGVFHDLETNVAISFEIKRRITRKDGSRYDDDMISTTGAAAAGIAFRNAVLKGIPKMFWLPLYEKALENAKPAEKDIAERRKSALEAFAKLEVPEAAILETLGVKTVSKIGADELVTLRGIYNAIKEGTTTAAEAFSLGPAPLEPTTEAEEQDGSKDKPPREKKKPPKAPATGVPKAKIPPEPKVIDKLISTKQQTEIYNIAMGGGWTIDQVQSRLKSAFKVSTVGAIRESQYAEVLKLVKAKP